jgi:hypothetical protein
MVFDPLWPKVGLAVSGITLLLAVVLIGVAIAIRKAKKVVSIQEREP